MIDLMCSDLSHVSLTLRLASRRHGQIKETRERWTALVPILKLPGLLSIILLLLANVRLDAQSEKQEAKTPESSKSLFPDEVLAKGNGCEVRRSQLEEAFITYRANQAARFQNVPQELPPA